MIRLSPLRSLYMVFMPVIVLQVTAQNHLAAIQPQFHTNLIDAVAELQTDLSTFTQEYEKVRGTPQRGHLYCVQASCC